VAKVYAPMIGEAEYWSLRWMMRRNLPETRDEWLDKDDRLRSNWTALGHEVEYVEVSPAEFLEFCWDRDWQPDLFALDRYVWEKRPRRQAAE
jgi:uncharacterized protein YndB with AHSA1/START domain